MKEKRRIIFVIVQYVALYPILSQKKTRNPQLGDLELKGTVGK